MPCDAVPIFVQCSTSPRSNTADVKSCGTKLLGFLSFLRRFLGFIILGNIVSELVEPELSSLATLTASVLLLRPLREGRDCCCCCWFLCLVLSGSHLSLATCSVGPTGRWLRCSGTVVYFLRSCLFCMISGAPWACMASLDTGLSRGGGVRPVMEMRGAPSQALGCGGTP